jgi:ribosomal protein S18 acetylase RimI-like enzyme
MTLSPEFRLDKAEAARIAAHLRACDEAFVSRLSERVDIDDYGLKIAGKALRFEAWADGELIGLVAVYCNDPKKCSAFITCVSVLPPWRGKGIAAQLMGRCIGHVRGLGFKHIDLEVDGSNVAAVTLYKKHRFATGRSSGQSMTMSLNLERD